LERNLDHHDPAVRLAAAVALAHIRPDSTRLPSILWEGLSHPDREIREKSFEGLKNLGTGVKAILPRLIDGLEDPLKRATSAALLGQIGPEASETTNRLISLLKLHVSGDWELRHYVPGALASIGSKAIGPLLGLLKHRDLFVQTRAIRTLGMMGPKAESVVPRLIEKLKAGDTAERIAAAEALGSIGPAAHSAIPVLRSKLKDRDLAILRVAIVALEKMKAAARVAVPDLAALLNEPMLGMQMKWAAMGALGAIGVSPVPVLVAALKNRSQIEGEARAFAAWVLADFGQTDPAVTSVLAECLRDSHPGVRNSAAGALGKIGPAAQTATTRLIELLDDECDTVRKTAGHALLAIAATGSPPEAALAGAC
jgi:HEAT repeat protein